MSRSLVLERRDDVDVYHPSSTVHPGERGRSQLSASMDVLEKLQIELVSDQYLQFKLSILFCN